MPQPRRNTYKKPTPDTLGFLGVAKTHLADAGYTLQILDRAWLRPEGAVPQDYAKRQVGDPNKDPVSRVLTYRGKWIAKVQRGQHTMSLFVSGPNEKSQYFEIRDGKRFSQKLDKIGPDTLKLMIEMVDKAAAVSVKNALNSARTFHII